MTVSTHDEIRVGQVGVRFLVESDQSAGSLSLFEFDVPAGAKVPVAHSHDAYEETIYGLDGILTWTVGGISVDLAPGDSLVIPRGAVHRFDNVGEADARALAIVTPGLLGPAYFREIAAVLDAASGGPPDLAAAAAVMQRHGLTPVLPTKTSSEV